jgi:hypothetical protein
MGVDAVCSSQISMPTGALQGKGTVPGWQMSRGPDQRMLGSTQDLLHTHPLQTLAALQTRVDLTQLDRRCIMEQQHAQPSDLHMHHDNWCQTPSYSNTNYLNLSQHTTYKEAAFNLLHGLSAASAISAACATPAYPATSSATAAALACMLLSCRTS